jgi:hypothetical protein
VRRPPLQHRDEPPGAAFAEFSARFGRRYSLRFRSTRRGNAANVQTTRQTPADANCFTAEPPSGLAINWAHDLGPGFSDRSFADPEVAARKLMEIANSVEPVQDGRIYIEKINWPFLSEFKGSPAQYGAGLKLAIERGWLWMHESGTYVKITPAGADLT